MGEGGGGRVISTNTHQDLLPLHNTLTCTEIFSAPEEPHCQSMCFPKSHTQARSSLPSNSLFKALSVSFHPSSLSLALFLSPSYPVSQFVMLQRQLGGSGHDAGVCKPRRLEVEAKQRWQAGATASQSPARRGENEGDAGVFPFHTSPLSSSWSIKAADLSLWWLLFFLKPSCFTANMP